MKIAFWLMLVVTAPNRESFVEVGNYPTMDQCTAAGRAEVARRADGDTKVRFLCVQNSI